MRRKLTIISICLACLVAGLLYSLPYIRVYQIISAVQGQDYDRLASYIDFPRLRQGLKEQVQSSLPAADRPNELDRIRRAMTAQVVEQTIEQLITPKGLVAVFYQYWAGRKDSALPQAKAEQGVSSGSFKTMALLAALLQQAQCRYASPSEFRIVLRDATKQPLTVVLTRNGLSWQWSRLEIPSLASGIMQP